ncbi:LOW QUALITY PROTEIN: CCR4-NOT transcription complex subunit 2-like [Megaptera novaeangliae]
MDLLVLLAASPHPDATQEPTKSHLVRTEYVPVAQEIPRNQAFGMNNSLSSNIFNGTDGSENVTGLDLSDFPALADRNRREGSGNPTPLINPLAGRAPYVGMVTKPANEQSQDFSIHNEDFPALPGSSYKDPTSSNDDSKSNLNTSGKTISSSGPKFPGDKSSTTQNNNQQKKGIQVSPDGRVTNIPQGMVTDQFGMIGLLTFIRAAETDPGMVHLALGSDLTTLGLNLNSPENLYPKFASPWASSPCRPQDIDFHVPSEYLTNIHVRDKLAAIKLGRYGEDLLFYLYYMNGGDVFQLLAAVELFNRDWRYHKEERVWITRAPGMEPTMRTNTYERGTYYFFDCLNWRKVAKELVQDKIAWQLRKWMLDIDDVNLNSKYAVYQLCAVGKLIHLSVSQFSHLENRNDSNCLTDRVILNIK